MSVDRIIAELDTAFEAARAAKRLGFVADVVTLWDSPSLTTHVVMRLRQSDATRYEVEEVGTRRVQLTRSPVLVPVAEYRVVIPMEYCTECTYALRTALERFGLGTDARGLVVARSGMRL